LTDIAEIGEGGEETMSRSFRKFDLIGEIADANAVRALRQYIKDGRSPFDCLDKIVWL
jgi:hypothetical protein